MNCGVFFNKCKKVRGVGFFCVSSVEWGKIYNCAV